MGIETSQACDLDISYLFELVSNMKYRALLSFGRVLSLKFKNKDETDKLQYIVLLHQVQPSCTTRETAHKKITTKYLIGEQYTTCFKAPTSFVPSPHINVILPTDLNVVMMSSFC